MPKEVDDQAKTDPAFEIPEPPEARREKRVRHRLTVGVTAHSQGQVSGWTSNLAVHGLTIAAARVFAPATEVKVVIMLPDQERASVSGKVAWSRKGIGGGLSAMGVTFTEENEAYVTFLRRFHPDVFQDER